MGWILSAICNFHNMRVTFHCKYQMEVILGEGEGQANVIEISQDSVNLIYTISANSLRY